MSNIFKNVASIHFFNAFLTYKDIWRVHGFKTAQKAFINRINGKPLFYGLDDDETQKLFNTKNNQYKVGLRYFEDQLKAKNDIKDAIDNNITIIVYLFNPNRFLFDRTVESINNQKHITSINVIYVDDGSYGGFEHAAFDNENHIRNEEHLGIAKTLNNVIKNVNTKYIVPIFDNTMLDDCFLYYLNNAIASNKNIYHFDSYIDDIDKNAKTKHSEFLMNRGYDYFDYLCNDRLGEVVCYKTDIFKKHRFDESAKYNYRYQLILNAIKDNESIEHIEKFLYCSLHDFGRAYGDNEKELRSLEEVNYLNKHFKNDNYNFVSSGDRKTILLNKQPKVSIVINNNIATNLKRSVASIISGTSYPNYEIVIISRESNFELFSNTYKNNELVKVINGHNKPLSEAYKEAAKTLDSDYLILLPYLIEPVNNNWVERIISPLLSNNVDMVSPIIINKKELIINAGYIKDNNNEPVDMLKGVWKEELANSILSVTYHNVTFASKHVTSIKRQTLIDSEVNTNSKQLFNMSLSANLDHCYVDLATSVKLLPSEYEKQIYLDYQKDEYKATSDKKEKYKYPYLEFANLLVYKRSKKEKFKYPKSRTNNADFEDRLNIILNGKKDGKKTIVYLYPQIENKGTFRYRVFNMCDALSLSDKYAASFFYSNELSWLKKYVDNFDLVVAARYGMEFFIKPILERCANRNIPVMFDIDDMVYDPIFIQEIVEEMKLNQQHLDGWTYGAGLYSDVANKAIAGITTGLYLAKDMHRYFGYPVYVIPNSLNKAQLNVQVEDVKKPTDKFVMGYFSGSKTHQSDFNQITNVLSEFLAKHEDAYLEVVGELDLPNELSKYGNRIIKKGRMSLTDLQKEIASVNLNIVPLIDTSFNSSKSELKFYEAAIANTVTLASCSYTYDHTIEDGVNGFKAHNPKEWAEKLEYIYNHRDELEKIDVTAKEYSLVNYYNINMISALETMFDDVFTNKMNKGLVDYEFVPTSGLNTFNKNKLESSFSIDYKLHC